MAGQDETNINGDDGMSNNTTDPPGSQQTSEVNFTEEYDFLDSKLDELNTALDFLEKKNDDIHEKLKELLQSNREIREQLHSQGDNKEQ